MDESMKKFIEEENEKLAIMVGKGFEQMSTKEDLTELRKEMTTGFADVRREMTTGFAEVRNEMATGFAEVRKEMTTGFAEVRNEMATKDDIVQLEGKIVSEVDLAHERVSALEIRVERLEVVR